MIQPIHSHGKVLAGVREGRSDSGVCAPHWHPIVAFLRSPFLRLEVGAIQSKVPKTGEFAVQIDLRRCLGWHSGKTPVELRAESWDARDNVIETLTLGKPVGGNRDYYTLTWDGWTGGNADHFWRTHEKISHIDMTTATWAPIYIPYAQFQDIDVDEEEDGMGGSVKRATFSSGFAFLRVRATPLTGGRKGELWFSLRAELPDTEEANSCKVLDKTGKARAKSFYEKAGGS